MAIAALEDGGVLKVDLNQPLRGMRVSSSPGKTDRDRGRQNYHLTCPFLLCYQDLAVFLNDNLPNTEIIAALIGMVSAVVDNVPLVAATMGMYGLAEHPTDDSLWQLIAYCAGTGGSMLIIGEFGRQCSACWRGLLHAQPVPAATFCVVAALMMIMMLLKLMIVMLVVVVVRSNVFEHNDDDDGNGGVGHSAHCITLHRWIKQF